MTEKKLGLIEAMSIAQNKQLAEQILLKHYAENIEKNLGFSAVEVTVNAMVEFYELMKNKNGNQTGTIS